MCAGEGGLLVQPSCFAVAATCLKHHQHVLLQLNALSQARQACSCAGQHTDRVVRPEHCRAFLASAGVAGGLLGRVSPDGEPLLSGRFGMSRLSGVQAAQCCWIRTALLAQAELASSWGMGWFSGWKFPSRGITTDQQRARTTPASDTPLSGAGKGRIETQQQTALQKHTNGSARMGAECATSTTPPDQPTWSP